MSPHRSNAGFCTYRVRWCAKDIDIQIIENLSATESNIDRARIDLLTHTCVYGDEEVVNDDAGRGEGQRGCGYLRAVVVAEVVLIHAGASAECDTSKQVQTFAAYISVCSTDCELEFAIIDDYSLSPSFLTRLCPSHLTSSLQTGRRQIQSRLQSVAYGNGIALVSVHRCYEAAMTRSTARR